MQTSNPVNRRSFLVTGAALTGSLGLWTIPAQGKSIESNKDPKSIYMTGPQEGYSPMVGTLLSTMTMMRQWLKDTGTGLSVAQLDFQIDDKSNSIGAMMHHLAATEKFYQYNTFKNMAWPEIAEELGEEWNLPMNLGPAAREALIGKSMDDYIKILDEVRADTEDEFKKVDDEWLMKSEPFFQSQPTTNHCKWFHVCEHESNHRGQMKFIAQRFPK